MSSAEEPSDVMFDDLMRSWAVSVARYFVWVASKAASPESIALREAWVGEDLALYARYVQFDRKLGVRIDRLDVDPTSGGRAVSSGRQAFFFYNNIPAGVPSVKAWKDSLGHEWWGDHPGEGWKPGVEDTPRVETVLSTVW